VYGLQRVHGVPSSLQPDAGLACAVPFRSGTSLSEPDESGSPKNPDLAPGCVWHDATAGQTVIRSNSRAVVR
jgi:hypothetical protein